MSPALWLVPALSILNLLYYFLLSMGYELPTFGFGIDRWKIGSAIFQGALLVVLALSHALDRRAPAAVCEPEPPEAEEVVQEPAPRAKADRKAPASKPKQTVAAPTAKPAAPTLREEAPGTTPRTAGKEVFEYPPKKSGGIYADSQIPLGGGRYLKLRTLVARSCLLCDEQDRCWDIIRHEVDRDFFRTNIDCKEGLNIKS
jgi:hypothetical protein